MASVAGPQARGGKRQVRGRNPLFPQTETLPAWVSAWIATTEAGRSGQSLRVRRIISPSSGRLEPYTRNLAATGSVQPPGGYPAGVTALPASDRAIVVPIPCFDETVRETQGRDGGGVDRTGAREVVSLR